VSADDVRVGVDIGGTFTDIVTVRDGDVHVTKTPSTPGAPEEGVVNGLEKSREEAAFAFDDVGFLSHGTTVATNAVLEGTWADTALVTTEGFRDVLEIARQNRPDIYDFDAEKPAPIVPRDRRFEVPGRLDERGNVLRELDEGHASDLADTIADTDVDSVAISLLFAFENGDHEQRVAELLREAGLDVSYSLSSDVLPEIREYERTLTTALNAALKPVMDSYIGNLEAQVRDNDVGAELKIMQSNGGLITADAARGRPVNTLLSGPAGGVQGATYVAERCGVEDIITMDMGGTSCDVSLVEGGEPLVSTDVTVGDYAVGVPMIDIHTVGSGGGSIAWVDEGGALRVGPRSAGADPGPISYGRGGTEPTTTDAHLLLGRLDPDRFLSGELDVEVDDVRDAFDERLGDELGMDPQEAAQGVLDVANANMQRALRVVSVERGYDPRDFGLVAFGGAGPMHANALADVMDAYPLIVPPGPGVMSAFGFLTSDVQNEFSETYLKTDQDVEGEAVYDAYQELNDEATDWLASEGVAEENHAFEYYADCRYYRQDVQMSIPIDVSTLRTEDGIAAIKADFEARHEQRFGFSLDAPLEIANLRVIGKGTMQGVTLEASELGDEDASDARVGTQDVFFDDASHDTPIYDRERMRPGNVIDGPAIVTDDDSTVVVQPDHAATVDRYANLEITRSDSK